MADLLHPDQLRGEARTAYREGDLQRAVSAFQAAEEGYRAIGDRLSAAEMANDRAVVLLLEGNAELALQALGDAVQVFADAGDLRRQAVTLGNRGDILEALGRQKEAMRDYEQAAELFRQTQEFELRAYVMKSISKLQFRQGRIWEALGTMAAGIEGIPNPSLSQRILKRLLDWPLKRLIGLK